MADAHKIEVTTTKVNLTLDDEEAQFLAFVMGYIGGDLTTPRRFAERISNALATSGITLDEVRDTPEYSLRADHTSIYFKARR